MIELLYISRATFPPGSERAQTDRILAIARVRNLALGVTGALVPIDGRFAQVLEGTEIAVNQLMVAILRDARHADIRIVRVNAIETRRFANWSMAEIAPEPMAHALLEALDQPHAEAVPADAAEALVSWLAARAGSARLL